MVSHPLDLEIIFEDPNGWPRDHLRQLNMSPVGYLAAVGVRCGARYEDAFDYAMDLIGAFGTSRRIRPSDATQLCRDVKAWVAGRLTPARNRPATAVARVRLADDLGVQ